MIGNGKKNGNAGNVPGVKQLIKLDEQGERMEQIPSIGRVVRYQRFGSPNGEHKSEPSAAIITQVFENNECQLFVMNPNGVYFNKTPYSVEPKPGHWSWPPKV